MTNNELFQCLVNVEGNGKCPRLPCLPLNPGGENLSLPPSPRTKFPVRVRSAIPTSKAQGKSFGVELGIYLRQDWFTRGLLFVFFPEYRTLQNLLCKIRTIVDEQ